jgi:hypothetical protein
MSKINPFFPFFSNSHIIESHNNLLLHNESPFQYPNMNEYSNIGGQPLFNIETNAFNNFEFNNNNGSILLNDITIKNNNKNNNKEKASDEYSDLSVDKKGDITINNPSKLFVKKKAGDAIDFRTKWKTEKCHNWEMHGVCKFAEKCAFAHGNEELKQKATNNSYKTKLCKQFFEDGFCPYGSRCQFSHKKKNYDNNSHINNNNDKYEINYSEIISNLLLNENITLKAIKRPRLMAFEEIVNFSQKEIENNRIKLYLDIINIKNIIRNQ